MKNCWIVGASSGIGFELAKKLCKNGFNIIASARSLENLNILKNQIEEDKKSLQNSENFGKIDIENVDVEDYQSLKKVWQNILAKNHKIDLVEEQAISNPYFKQTLDGTKHLIYGA